MLEFDSFKIIFKILIDECILDPCVNGQCITKYQSYACDCHQNWEGQNCDIEINDCRRESFSKNSDGTYKKG